MGIEPTSEAWELSETATYAPVSVRTNMSIRKERYWLRNRELVHGAKMYVMPQLGVRISWRERCKPGPRHHPRVSWPVRRRSPLCPAQHRFLSQTAEAACERELCTFCKQSKNSRIPSPVLADSFKICMRGRTASMF
jgi:hypothetical protein